MHAGAYRQLHARLRTNAEPVAFYGGVEKEGGLITGKFKQLVKHQLKLLNTQWRFAMWQVSLGMPGLLQLSKCSKAAEPSASSPSHGSQE